MASLVAVEEDWQSAYEGVVHGFQDKGISNVWSRAQETTVREYQSTIATRYMYGPTLSRGFSLLFSI